jgi:hypothetical protein
MLAEELLYTSRRRLWQIALQRYGDDFAVNADAVFVSCRIEALRRDADYRDLVAPPPAPADALLVDVLASHQPVVEWLARHCREHAGSAARAGVALLAWLALRALPH